MSCIGYVGTTKREHAHTEVESRQTLSANLAKGSVQLVLFISFKLISSIDMYLSES